VQPGAVIVGGDYVGLGVVQSLGRRGIPVCVVDDEFTISQFSRYTDRFFRVSSLRSEARCVESLLKIGERFRLHGWVLIPTRDESVGIFSRNRATLETVFRVSTPPWSQTEWAWDKRKSYELADAVGVPTPHTWYVGSDMDLDNLDIPLPAVIKPAIKENFIHATRVKAWGVATRDQLVRRFNEARALVGVEEVMIQEWIPGDGRHHFSYCCFFKNGAPLATMVVRRSRQHPLDFGRASTYAETVEAPELERLSKKLLARIDFSGLAELEYKYDVRQRCFKLLDFNARCWGYHSLGARAGTDFASLAFDEACGWPVAHARAQPGKRWIRLVTDLPTGALEIKRGRIRLDQYIRSVLRADVESVFALDDPVPGILEIALIPYLMYKRGF
jgi:D-aspartate ligase